MNKPTEHKTYEFDDFRVDVGHLMLYHRGSEVAVVPKAVETLIVLIEHRGKIISKDELLEAVWPDAVVEESNLFLYLSLLRKTLGTRKNGTQYVETFRRRGYRFNGEVNVDEKVEDSASLNGDFSKSGSRVSVQTIGSYDQDSSVRDEFADDKARAVSEPERATAQITNLEHPKNSRKPYAWAISIGVVLVGALVSGSFIWRSQQTAIVANASGQRTLAILPFRSVVTSERDEAWELGMADMLITRLGSIRSLQVRPLGSVRGFNNPDQDPIAAGKALNVESVLEGSQQRFGDQIRFNVRLIKVADGTTIWVDSLNEKFTDMFAVQEKIATRIASSLVINLTSDETTRLRKRYSSNPEAESYYHRARFNELKITKDGLQDALKFYDQAIAADPNFALAYAHMANAHRVMVVAGFGPRTKSAFLNIKRLAMKALELDGSLAEAHVQLGFVDFAMSELDSAETRFKTAIELDPSDFQAHLGYAFLLVRRGKNEEAVAEARRATESAPMTVIALALESQILLQAGHADAAIAQAKKALDFDPDFWVARLHLGRAYASQKRYAEAIAEYERAREFAVGSYVPSLGVASAYADVGDDKKAYNILHEMERRSNDQYVSPLFLARVYNKLGQTERALDLLQKSEKEGEFNDFIKRDKSWDNLRSDPRFVELSRRMNL